MLKKTSKIEMNFSLYQNVYKLLITDNNRWRRMDKEIDFRVSVIILFVNNFILTCNISSDIIRLF